MARSQDTRLVGSFVSYIPVKNNWNLKSETSSFTMAPKILKYLSINLIKYVHDLYVKNYKTRMTENKKKSK